jgi:rhamnulokinase
VNGIHHVAFDLGAESGRAIAGRYDGARVSLTEIRRFPTPAVRRPDGLYWDAAALETEVCAALADVRAAGLETRSIGIDSWGCDFGLLDEAGDLIEDPLHHRDGRGAKAMDLAFARVPADSIYETTGIQFLPFNTLFQLLALQEAGTLERAATMLLVPDLLGHRLTGERLAEATNASTTQLLDVHTGEWAERLIVDLGLPRTLFPPVREPGTVVGDLLPEVAEATGMPSSTRVVAVASHDTASAVVALPAEQARGAAFISSGTWSLVGTELDAPVLSEQARRANLTNERGFAGRIRLLKNVMGLWLLQECRRAWAAQEGASDYGELALLAGAAAAGGPLFDPDVAELLAPGDMPNRIRALCRAGGEADPVERPVLVRAIFESLACKYRYVLDEIERVTGTPIDTVHVLGGGARNDLLCRITADVTRRRVLAGPIEAAALGNVLVQLHAFGELGSLEEMRDVARESELVVSFEVDPDGSRWEELYERFLRIAATSPVEKAGVR